MNNDLEQFSEETLMFYRNVLAIDFGGNGKIDIPQSSMLALVNIALAAKQARPEYHIVRLELNDAWGSETVLNAYESQLDASKCKDDHGGVIIPCYTTPQPAHTEQVNSPMQPLHIDEFGTIRFKANAIVQHLLDVAGNVGVNMNTIAMQGFEPEDQMQFAQLIGYSLSGYGDLSYVTYESYERASAAAAAPKPESE